MPNVMNHLYGFGAFQLDPSQRLLLCEGRPVQVTPKAFELLVALVERGGRLVEKEELLGMVWPGVTVEEGNLTVMVSHLRKVLGDDRGRHQYIETVSKHGYRFVAPVVELGGQRITGPPAPLSRAPEVSPPEEHRPPGSLHTPSPLWSRPQVYLAGAVVVLVIAVSALFFASRVLSKSQARGAVATPGTIHSIAVLPFRTIGTAAGDEYLGLGTTDALITKLGNAGKIIVRPTSAIEQYRNGALSPEAAGKQQGVDAVLDGRIQREEGRLRLTVQLVRVRDGAELWADTFDEKYTDIFALEDEVSERVVRSLRLRLTDADVKRITKRPTENALAYEAYIKGRYFWSKRTGDGLWKGLDYFREAIRLDPAFAGAYEGVADSYAALGLYAVMPPVQAFPAAREAATKALQMDDGLADAHATLGLIHFYYDWDGPAAQSEFRRAVQANPSYAMAHSWSGESLAAMGRFPEAAEEARQALNDDPLSLAVNTNAGWTFCLAGQPDTAIETLRKAIEMDQAFPRSHFRLGMVYGSRGLKDQAIAELQKAVRLSGGDPYYEASLGHAYAVAGRAAEAHQILDNLKRRSAHEYIPAYGIALVYAGLNDRVSALQWLAKASVDRSTSMAFAKVDPSLAMLRSDPEFLKLTQRLAF
ncbi:MAG: transcriptional regulator, CadC [Acidobacteriaceae bacterium]|nr:transcriptional regulator, CadC [Acidobacteriaceae bacterium]